MKEIKMSLTVVDKSMILSVYIAAACAILGLLSIPSSSPNSPSSFNADSQVADGSTTQTMELLDSGDADADAALDTRSTMIMLMENDSGVPMFVPQFVGPEQDSGVVECL